MVKNNYPQYDGFSMEDLEKLLEALAKNSTERKMSLVTGKGGAINFLVSFKQEAGIEFDEDAERAHLEETLSEGPYRITTTNGLEYLGNEKQ